MASSILFPASIVRTTSTTTPASALSSAAHHEPQSSSYYYYYYCNSSMASSSGANPLDEDVDSCGESDIESGTNNYTSHSRTSRSSPVVAKATASSSALSAWCRSRNNNNKSNHNYIHNNGSTISTLPKGLAFRRIRPSDRQQIQQLHEEWFPVSYQDEFYDSLVEGRMLGTDEALVTLLLVEPNDDDSQEDDDDHSTIVAALVGSWIPLHTLSAATRSALLLSAPSSPHSMVPSYNHSDNDKYYAADSQQQQQQQFFYIMTLGCRPEYRGQGLATLLLRACLDDCRRAETWSSTAAAGVYLHVWTENHVAIRMYERLHFQRRQYIPNYYQIRGEPHACYLYALRFCGEGHPPVEAAGMPQRHYRHWRRRFQQITQQLWWSVVQAVTMVEHGWRHYSFYWYSRRRQRQQQWIQPPPTLEQGHCRRRHLSERRTDDDNNNNNCYLEKNYPSFPTKNDPGVDAADDTVIAGSTISSCGSSSTTSSSSSSSTATTYTASTTTNAYATTARRRERWDCP